MLHACGMRGFRSGLPEKPSCGCAVRSQGAYYSKEAAIGSSLDSTLCFFLCVASTMAAIPPHGSSRLCCQPYANADIFRHAFVHASDLDKYAKRLLTAWDATLKEEDGWSYHPAMGALRAVRTTLHASVQSREILIAREVADVSVPTTGFLSKFPGFDLHSGNLPSLAYLQLIMSQSKGGVWSWTPWRKILSEAAVNEVKGRKKESKRGELLDHLAQTAGIDDSEWDLDLPSALYKVFLILQVRAHAFVMVGGGHLATWMGYINKFMGHYQRKVGPATRAPSASEAEEADRTVLSEVFRMVFYDGYTLDDALGVVCKEDLLRCHLIALPKLVLKPAVCDQPPIKRKRVADEKCSGAEKKKPCRQFQATGKCSFGDKCKFTRAE